MRGIDIAGKQFETYGLPMLERDFCDLLPRLAVGIAGRGSECFGFDDEISQDHDFCTGFSIWISEADDRTHGFKLTRAYNELYKNFLSQGNSTSESRLGSPEHGVCIIPDFFRRHLGIPGAPQCWQEWFYTPEYAFAEAVNGEIFRDDSGVFTGIRNQISSGIPDDVRMKKLAGYAILMAQSGQYNFTRCLKHGEYGAAMLALSDFVRYAAMMFFWLKRRFAPYYKWLFRAMRDVPENGGMPEKLESLFSPEISNAAKAELIENICAWFAAALRQENLSSGTGTYLEPHAFEIMSRIRSREIRALHIMDV